MKQIALAVALASLSTQALAQQAAPVHFISSAGTNSTLVKAGSGRVTSIVTGNNNASAAWLKLYDKATAPTCGTDTPVNTFLVVTQQTLAIPLGEEKLFLNGIGFCITLLIADSDTTAGPANIVVNMDVK